MSIIDDFLADTREHMNKSVDATRGKFGSVRTGRVSPMSDSRIARSIALTEFLSYGCTVSRRASGAETVASCFSGVIVP